MGTDVYILNVATGARRDRTADLLHAMQALSQLSYSPAVCGVNNTEYYNSGQEDKINKSRGYWIIPVNLRYQLFIALPQIIATQAAKAR